MWNGTMFVDLDWPLNASSLLSASAELLVIARQHAQRDFFLQETQLSLTNRATHCKCNGVADLKHPYLLPPWIWSF